MPRGGALVRPSDDRATVRRWLRGQAAAARKQREILVARGPDPAQAVAELRSALAAMATMGLWPGPRDAAGEAGVEEVRRRWARIQRHARKAQGH